MSGITARFTLIIADLRAAVAVRAGHEWHRVSVFGLLWGRLARMVTRFEALFARWQAGTLARPRRAARPPSPAAAARRAARPPLAPDLRESRRRGWLLSGPERFRWVAAATASRLQFLFIDPEMAAFLQAAPQAGRILRPLCRMVGIDPPEGLRLPPRPPRPRPPAPARPTPAAPPPPARPRRRPGRLPPVLFPTPLPRKPRFSPA